MRAVIFGNAALLASVLLTGGCKSWRTICLEPHDLVGREARTDRKYEIVSVRYETSLGPSGDARIEALLDPMFGSTERLDRIMQYRPGVFESRGVPVTLTVREYHRYDSGQWTWFFPFALTATIVPAFLNEEDCGELDVSVGKTSRKVAYRGRTDWRLSCIGCLGSIPYPQPTHPSAYVWARGDGETSLEPVREGLADAIAAALIAMEKSGAGQLPSDGEK